MDTFKGNRVKLSTFKKWNTGGLINYETSMDDGCEYVTKVWCVLCAKHSTRLRSNLRGQTLKDIDCYIMGTNFVKKTSVDRHLCSKTHSFSVQYDKDLGADTDRSESVDTGDADVNKPTTSAPKIFRNIQTAMISSSRDAYKKLITDAYILAVDGQPLSALRTIVRAQKATGTRLIKGTDSHKSAREFIAAIGNAIREKMKKIMLTANAFTILSDGSQARKTGNEKELVLARILKDGVPVYCIVALQDINEYGDATADNVKAALDDAFLKKLGLPQEKYVSLMVAAMADGTNVNMGIYNGVLTQLRRDREWLLKIHCVSHRTELAIKDSINKEKKFESVLELLQSLYQFGKQSGKFRAQFKRTAQTLNVQVYNFPKTQGTRFISHQLRGIDHLLKNWMPLLQAIENAIACQDFSKVNAKLLGFHNKLRNIEFLSTCVVYRQVVRCLSSLSKQFEKELVLVCDVARVVERCFSKLDDIGDSETDLKNILADVDMKFNIISVSEEVVSSSIRPRAAVAAATTSVKPIGTLKARIPKHGHTRRKIQNREFTTLDYDIGKLTHINFQSNSQTFEIAENLDTFKSRVITNLKECLKTRFAKELDESDLYADMQVLTNPALWVSTKQELDSINKICDAFQTTLTAIDVPLDRTRIDKEWRDLKLTVKRDYNGVKPLIMWEKIFVYKRRQLPNVCLIIELLLCIGVSNSHVERGFSILTGMLTDRRLSMSHTTMENLLLIKGNNPCWSNGEREELIEMAVDGFISGASKRKIKLEPTGCVNQLHYQPRKRKHYDSSSSNSGTDSDGQGSENTDMSDDDIDFVDSGDSVIIQIESLSVIEKEKTLVSCDF